MQHIHYTHMLREADNIKSKEQHIVHPMQWNQTRVTERMSLGKSSTATQPRTSGYLQFNPKLRVLATDQLPFIDIFNGHLITSFMIWFPLAMSPFWVDILINFPRLFMENLTFLFRNAFPIKSLLSLLQSFNVKLSIFFQLRNLMDIYLPIH